ncbi:uncharacterized protein A4U43_C10F13690 [Asparagus officinalis]|uniref:Uncharacterized protein n=1 Tax=Asparagus officinalis TaxID=4686 RepID=A0A5P1E2K6_ASPOF|nr:uncharacterized protein A4U43_C10F13690 [Asparagus officinalis]
MHPSPRATFAMGPTKSPKPPPSSSTPSNSCGGAAVALLIFTTFYSPSSDLLIPLLSPIITPSPGPSAHTHPPTHPTSTSTPAAPVLRVSPSSSFTVAPANPSPIRPEAPVLGSNLSGCTGAKFSLPSSERQLNLTFLSCKWLLVANKTILVKPIAELEAEEASQVDSRRIRENARSQRTRNKTRRIDEEGKKTFHSADEASGGDPEDYEDFSERGTTVDQDEEFRPPPRARPSIIVPAARRKRLARKPRAASRASGMNLAGDDPASDGGERGESKMSPDSVPVSPDEPDPLPQVERPTWVADIREDSNVGPDSVDPGLVIDARKSPFLKVSKNSSD